MGSPSRWPPPTRGAASSTKTWGSGRSRCTKCSSSRALSGFSSSCQLPVSMATERQRPGEDPHAGLRLVTQGSVEDSASPRRPALQRKRCRARCNARPLLPGGRGPRPAAWLRGVRRGLRCWRRAARGDVGTEGEDEDADHPAFVVGGQYLYVAGLDAAPELFPKGRARVRRP